MKKFLILINQVQSCDQGYNVDPARHLNRPQDILSKLLAGASLQLYHVSSYCGATHEGFLSRGAFQGSLFYLNRDKELVQCQHCPTRVKRPLCLNTNGSRPKDVQDPGDDGLFLPSSNVAVYPEEQHSVWMMVGLFCSQRHKLWRFSIYCPIC